MAGPLNTSTTPAQEFVPIKEIRDNVVILKDGSYRSVLLCSSLNFALKSQDEQTSIILQFQNFLNSLNFSVQIVMQSRKLDIRPYISLLEDRLKAQTIDLMKIQTREYIEFIKGFTEAVNIMTKNFYVVVPYSPALLQNKKGIMSKFNFLGNSSNQRKESGNKAQDEFDEHRTQLAQRVGVVESGLTRCGIRIAELGTEEVVELFYKVFNPGDIEKPIQPGGLAGNIGQ